MKKVLFVIALIVFCIAYLCIFHQEFVLTLTGKEINSGETLIGEAIILVVIGGFLIYEIAKVKHYFCAKCDQYLGKKALVCPRCGSNRTYNRTTNRLN